MAWLYSRLVLWQVWVQRRLTLVSLALIGGVAAWWLCIVGVIMTTVPTPETPDMSFTLGIPATLVFVPTPTSLPVRVMVPGQTVHISLPSEVRWLVTTDRVTYDDYERALLGHEDSVTVVFARAGWVAVVQGQVARIIDIDRDDVRVELLSEPNVGVRVWMRPSYLVPVAGAL